MARIKQDDWTATAITLPTLYGLKVRAARNHRSVGQELEHVLVKQVGIERLKEKEYSALISQIEQGRA